ncbi:DUF3027 family protein [Nocardia mexicana]|uniref:DUF3027 family protein n=1 Tax=Nocardia mexicana TaxID=279262 RepID=A0A370GI81_9NOCA|nr:DUF3027 family protein [Nocardia mexicana]
MRPILAEAVDLARRALAELQPTGVGPHLGVSAEDECAATHHFEATLPGYHGWQWAVVVAAPPEAERATVSESALLPGPDALVAPEFVPWDQRVRPGDLAPGDLLAPPPHDPRLVPGYLVTGDPVVDDVAEDLGLGRSQVLSREGREEAGERWYSEYGPETDMARAAPSTCGLCGFYVPLDGALRAAFGVCANAMGADGRVVHNEYGCGAHSDTVAPSSYSGSPLYEAYDDAAVEVIPSADLRQRAGAEGAGEQAAAPTETADTGVRQDARADQDSTAGSVVGAESASNDAGSAVSTGAASEPDSDTAAGAPAAGLETAESAAVEGAEILSAGADSDAAGAPDAPVGDARTEPAVAEVAETPSADAASEALEISEQQVGGAGNEAAEAVADGSVADDAAETGSASADTAGPVVVPGTVHESSEADRDGESADGAGRAQYSDAWGVSSVRVQRAEPGAAGEH